jgi:hypothetical protein
MKLPGIRWGVRGVLALGVAASTVANILHAEPNGISRTIAAWPPLALLLTIELMSRIPVHRLWLAVARLGAAGVIAGIAAWVSYWHMAGVALRYGEASDAAHLLPLSVDGLIVVASICLVELGGRIRAAEEINEGGSDGDQLVSDWREGERGDHLVRSRGGVPGGEGDAQSAEEGGAAPRREGGTSAGELPAREGVEAPAQIEPPKPPARKPHTTNPKRVAQAHRKTPDATHQEIATRLNLSPATVKKYRPPREPQKVNGKVPELEGVK